jgi:hypothetical protein
MISIKTNYEQVLKDYPQIVEEFLTNLKESHSVSKNIELEKIKWFYTWGKYNKKPKTEEERTLNNINLQNRMGMTYDQRLPLEFEKVKVNVTMEAGQFVRGDRVGKDSPLSELIMMYETELLKIQMLNEQKEFNDAHILNSIPEPNKEILEQLVPPEVRAMQEKMREAMENGRQEGGQPNATRRNSVPNFEVDDLLDKISDEGYEALTEDEKTFLKNKSNDSK